MALGQLRIRSIKAGDLISSDGGLSSFDLLIGDVAIPIYGMVRIGNAVIGRTSYKAGNIDLDGAVIIRNIGGPETSQIEFVFCESTGNTARFVIPKSGVGNATYNPRSMLIAGPAPANTDMVKVGFWQDNHNIFHNLLCDTSGVGADLGVQNDLEVEGNIFSDSIKESTPGAGNSFGDGGSTNFVKIGVTGDLTFHGSAGLQFGSCYGMEIGWTQANAVQNTWYDISDADMADGMLHGITHDGNGQLTVGVAGMYMADWSGAFEADAANVHVLVTFSINGTEVNQGMNHYHTVAVSREAPLAGNAILDLSAGDTVNVSIRTTDAGTPDLLVDHLMLRLVQIGGT